MCFTGRILSLLEDWATNNHEKYDKFFTNFGLLFKTGLSTDYGNRDRLIDLLRFESTKNRKGKLTSLKDYVAGMQGRSEGDLLPDWREQSGGGTKPKSGIFQEKGTEVLFFIDPADIFNIRSCMITTKNR